MQNLPEIRFHRQVVTASEETIQRRADAVERLSNLGHIDGASGELNTTETRWTAQIGDTEFVVMDFAVQKGDDGQLSISLAALADKVSFGAREPEAGAPLKDEERALADRHQLVVDRLTFANQTSMGEQVATHAEMRDQIQRSGGIL